MQDAGEELRVDRTRGLDAERAAASTWSRATAARDELPTAVPPQEKLAGIQRALAEGGASLHLARRGRCVVGFCLLVPQGESLEIRYLATEPEAWGSGVGRVLLEHVQEHAHREGFARGELWVIADNVRAVGLYERAGWTATGAVEVRGPAGRAERRLVRDFT